MSYITAIGTATPPHAFSQVGGAQFMGARLGLSAAEQRKLQVLYRATAIEQRHSVIPDVVAQPPTRFEFFPQEGQPFPSTATRMAWYERCATPLALEAIAAALSAERLAEVTHLVTMSCTGLYAPGLDIELLEQTALRSTVHRTGINFMGCYAAFNALKVADAFCQADPSAKVLVVGVELCTLHVQDSQTHDDLVAGAIFSDGAAALLVEGAERKANLPALRLRKFYCDLQSEGREAMAWYVRDTGFLMKLSAYVPQLLEKKVTQLLEGLLDQAGLPDAPIEHYALHPGGRKILDLLAAKLGLRPDQTAHSREVLRQYGNMSSVTVLFVLAQLWQQLQAKPAQAPIPILSMAFGPGLTLEAALLEALPAEAHALA